MADPLDTARNHRGVDTGIAAAEIAASISSRLRYLVHKSLCDHGDQVTRTEASTFLRSYRVLGRPTTFGRYESTGSGNCSPRTASTARA